MRNLPSNNTICEVSEKDSDYDERSRTIKRKDIRSALNTCQSSQFVPNSQLSNYSVSKFG